MNEQKDNFDRIAAGYDRVHPAHIAEHYLRKRVALIGRLLNGGDGLDVGCGTGVLMEALKPYGRVIGVDASEGMLDVLRREGRGEAVHGSLHELPFADDRFDVVFSVAVLHHLIEPPLVAKGLCEMVRVTRPGGKVVVWDHNPLNPYWPIIMKRVPQDHGDERLVPLREIEQGLTATGARIVRSFASGLMPDFMPRCLMPPTRVVEAVFEHTPLLRRLCAHNVIIAMK